MPDKRLVLLLMRLIKHY